MKNYIYNLILLLIFSSCSTRNLVYFSDLPQNTEISEEVLNVQEPTIQPIDLLSITVSTLNPESNLLFNSGIISNTGGSTNTSGTVSMINSGYRVDKTGSINFPVLGKIEVAGLTLDEATEKITQLLQKEAKSPIVNVKLLNFRITVIGEVKNPNTFPVLTERINIVEAIGLAGDLTPYGKRENVLLIREVDGVRTTVRLDLNKKAVFSSPYFFLQQNDVIYVEPVKARAEQASVTRSHVSLTISIVSIISLLLTRFVL